MEVAPLVADLLNRYISSTAGDQPRAAPPTRRAGIRRRTSRVAGVFSSAMADVARAPAVRLFVERVRDVQPDFHLTAANGPAVAAICRRLDALPLALELAAPWIKVLTVQDLLRRLEDNVLLSTAGPRDLPERQQTMNATVAWSYQLLDPDEQRAFRRLRCAARVFFRSPPPPPSSPVVRMHRPGRMTHCATVACLMDKSLLQRAPRPRW